MISEFKIRLSKNRDRKGDRLLLRNFFLSVEII